MTLTNTFAKVASALVAASLVVGVAFVAVPRAEAAALTAAQVQSIISLLQSFGADSATIANVQASLTGSTPSVPSTPSTPASCSFTRDLTVGAKGADVTALQQGLIAAGYAIPAGATGTFGPQTQTAVMAWQKAAGITPAAGYFGAKSRAAFKCASGPTSGPTTPAPTGTGVAVGAGSQPANALAPQNATRVPFTRFTLTAGNDGDVKVNSVQVQLVGFGQTSAFQGIILVDDATGMQIGTAKTFNSNKQAAIGAAMTIPKGTTKSFTVAGNMASSLVNNAGEAPAISVIGVNTSATVSGSLPITGAYHTINATLTVGTLSIQTSNAFAANANATKEIGTTAYKQTGFRLTAGSAEDVKLMNVTFNQTGSASSNDIANVVVNVGGTNYPATVSADGKYYTATLGSGLLIPKGNQVDVYVQYDIVGSGASNRTIIFDVDKNTDIYGVGQTYGFGVSPAIGGSSVPGSRGTITITNGTPYIYSTQTTVSGASITTISKANEVPAQNIAINLSNQPLGGYVVDLKGESMTVQSQVFFLNYSSGSASGNLLTNVTLVDSNGAVVAGPVDAVNVGGTAQKVTFTDTVTYKTGRVVYTLRGKVPTTATNGVVITASTTPSSDWTNAKGETTGNSISLSSFNTAVAFNPMTIKAGSIIVGRATTPASQNIVAGGASTLFANFQLDASNSGEDVRFSSAPLALTVGGSASVSSLTGCQLFDGATALNTGSNSLNPSSQATTTVTLDNPVTVTKGTVKTLGLRCNVSGSAANNNTFAWDIGDASAWTFTGATSGTTIVGSDATDSAVVFTIQSGAATVTSDASAPAYMIASAGTTGVLNNAIKFRASNENVNLTKLGLSLGNTASSTSGDLVKATIWDGATKVGEAFFVGSQTVATSTLTAPVNLTKDTDKVLTVKVDLANISTSDAVTFSGHLLAVNFLNAEGVGASSGSTVYPTGTGASNGTRIMKSFPTIAVDTLSSTGVNDGKLLRFRVTADAQGPVGITQFRVNLATTTLSVTNVNIRGFTDSGYSTPISGVSSDGSLLATASTSVPATGNIIVPVQDASSNATVIQIPAGTTRYFEVYGSIAGAVSGASVTTKLLGDSSFVTGGASSATVNPLVVASNASLTNFVWSPNSTTTAVRASNDWANGFGVAGLPSGGIVQTRSQ